MILMTAVSVSANTIYHSDGYSYTDMDEGDNLVSLCGWDNRTPELVVPDYIGKYYFGEVADYGLQGNTGFTSLDLTGASNLRRIGMFAFEGCEGLSGVVKIPYRIKEIGISAFQNCYQLEGVKIFANIKTIPAQAFYNCSSLKDIELPTNLEKIDNLAFANCVSIQRITIPKTVNWISKSAFSGDSNVVICCYRDSYAEQFAIDNGLEYDILDPLIGDVNGDEEITIMDATIIQKKSLGMATADVVSNYDVVADVSKDGFVNIRDVTLIQMYVAGIITEF